MIFYTNVIKNTQENCEKFNRIYEDFYLYAYKIAFEIIRDVQKMEDVMQVIFTNIWRSLDKMIDEQSTKALIAVITKNTAINENKKYETISNRFMSIDDDIMYEFTLDLNNNNNQNPVDIVVNQENIQYIYSEIKSLKSIYSEILLLNLKFHFTPEMISNTLHINIKTVYTRLNRGTKLLRKKLEEKGLSGNE